MIYKFLSFFFVLIIFCSFFSCVTGNQTVNNSIKSSGISNSPVSMGTDYNRNNSYVYVSSSGDDAKNDGSATKPYHSLKKAVQSVSNNGVIYVLPGDYSGNANNNLTINKNITIKGVNLILKNTTFLTEPSSETYVCDNLDTIFIIKPKTTMQIHNLNFKNNNANNGSIVNEGILTLKNCHFKSNKAVSGSAVNNYNTLLVNDSSFLNNECSGNGGAIFSGLPNNFEDDTTKIIMTQTSFENNKGACGGAIFAKGESHFKHCNFENNRATSGGAIFNAVIQNSINCTIEDSTFKANKIDKKSFDSSYFGGSIYNTGKLFIKGSNFIKNKAEVGGAIKNVASLTITQSKFEKNSADTNGGAIQSDEWINLTDTDFTDNYASQCGGVLSNKGQCLINHCNLKSNKALDGGAISTEEGSHINIIGVTVFNENNALNSGGAVYNQGNMNIESGGAIFTGNSAIFGGAINNLAFLNIDHIIIMHNKASGGILPNNGPRIGGGGIYNANRLVISDSYFEDNLSPKGGAIDNLHYTTIHNSEFKRNGGESFLFYKIPVDEDACGGAILNRDNLEVEHSNFTDNHVFSRSLRFENHLESQGGAIYNDEGTMATISSSSFKLNSAISVYYDRSIGWFWDYLLYDHELIDLNLGVDEYINSAGRDIYNCKNVKCELEYNTFGEESKTEVPLHYYEMSHQMTLNTINTGTCSFLYKYMPHPGVVTNFNKHVTVNDRVINET